MLPQTTMRPSLTLVGPPSTYAEMAFNQIRADILSGKLAPGEKMHVERLKERYGLGATPLREALSKLSSLNLVVAEGQRGFKVAPVSVADLLDVTKTRTLVECLALRLSIGRGDRLWEAEILASAHRLEGCQKTVDGALTDEWDRENRAFHDSLVAACGSPQIMIFREQLYDLSARYRRLSVQGGLSDRDLDLEHRQILGAVLAKDADSAVRLIEDHFIETLAVILRGEFTDAVQFDKVVSDLRAEIRSALS